MWLPQARPALHVGPRQYTNSAWAAVQALCINDDVLHLGSLPRINERCQELRAPKAKKQAAQETGKVFPRLTHRAAPPEPSPSPNLRTTSCQVCSSTATPASCPMLSAGDLVTLVWLPRECCRDTSVKAVKPAGQGRQGLQLPLRSLQAWKAEAVYGCHFGSPQGC